MLLCLSISSSYLQGITLGPGPSSNTQGQYLKDSLIPSENFCSLFKREKDRWMVKGVFVGSWALFLALVPTPAFSGLARSINTLLKIGSSNLRRGIEETSQGASITGEALW